MKTVGIQRADGLKDYGITHEGQTYYCTRNGSRWECRDQIFTSVKDIKAAILAGQFDQPEPEQPQSGGVWDCINPCAHIVKMLENGAPLTPEILLTLNCNGWLDDHGNPDYAQANRHYIQQADIDWL